MAIYTKWYKIYPDFARLLHDNYNKNGSITGEILFKKASHSKYVEHFEWIKNHKNNYQASSIDPIHIFASFNERGQSDFEREQIIKIWIEILKVDLPFDYIDFSGCPAPLSLKIISSRDNISQNEIWQKFSNVMSEGQEGIGNNFFSEIKKWYGIEIASFTIFLFWIKPKDFLPLDRNSEKILLENHVLESMPRTYEDYMRLLVRKDTDLYIRIARAGDKSISSINRDEDIARKIHRAYSKSQFRESNNFIFRLIALKPLEKLCLGKRKSLHPDIVYRFYNNYIFHNDDKIGYDSSRELPLYNLPNLQINVSAIVGKNGSGKSTLSELLFLAINNLAKRYLDPKTGSDLVEESGLYLELYYHSATLHRINFAGENITCYDYEYLNGYYQNPKVSSFKLDTFFYSIAVNYSLYGLNSIELGNWIENLFHKNDAYQAPLVINPYRDHGNFNVNRENELAKARLLSNLLERTENEATKKLKVLTDNGKHAATVRLNLKTNKKTVDDRDLKKLRVGKEYIDEYIDEDLNQELEDIAVKFFLYFDLSNQHVSDNINRRLRWYIANKLLRICLNYLPYQYFLTEDNKMLKDDLLYELFEKIDSDNSHITYKIRQVINFYKLKTYEIYEIHELNKDLDIEELSIAIDKIKSGQARIRNLSVTELLPPAIFSFEIFLDDKSPFTGLSSGERQKIYTASSILYHLSNLNSVSVDNDLINYQCVNIIFDEVELYFHPEMQRTFIDYLLKYLQRSALDNIFAINFCFITHSPFILSDIPSQNILFLDEKGRPDQALNELETLGGNIHDLLGNSFFLSNKGYIGEYIKNKINDAIAFLELSSEPQTGKETNKDAFWTKELVYSFIQSIGEILIKESLMELYYNKYGYTNSEIDKEIERLQKLKS